MLFLFFATVNAAKVQKKSHIYKYMRDFSYFFFGFLGNQPFSTRFF